MAIENWVVREIEALTAFRHDSHENPELLYETERTAAKVADDAIGWGCSYWVQLVRDRLPAEPC